MGKSEYYVAPCWSNVYHNGLTQPGETNPVIQVLDEELPLAEGLRRMAEMGWELMTVEANQPLSEGDDASAYPRRPVSYYLFRKRQ